MESYMIVMVCCFINLRFLDWETDVWNRRNSRITCFLTGIFLIFPFLSNLFLWFNFDKVQTQGGFEKKYG